MATEDQNIKITFDTNAGKAAIESNKLAGALDNVEDSGAGAVKSMHDLDATFDDVYKGMKPLTAMLGEAEDRLYQLGIQGVKTGDEYEGLLRKVAEYRKIQIETDRTVDAAATTLGQKLAGGAQLAATGVQGVTAGMALFGDQSEDTEKALLKVQAAMSFADAIGNISTLGGQFKVYKNIVVETFGKIVAAKATEKAATEAGTAAQIRQNLAVLANPYVIAAAALAALVIGIYAWNKSSSEAAKREEELKTAIDKTSRSTKSLEENTEELNRTNSDANDIEVLRARAYGATDKEIQALIKSQKELSIQRANDQKAEAFENYRRAESEYYRALKGDNEENTERAKENLNEALSFYKKTQEQKRAALLDSVKTELQTQIDANSKAKEVQDKADEEAKKNREEAKKNREGQKEKNKEAAKKDREEDAAALLDFQAKIAYSDQERAVEERTQKVENLKELNKEIGEVSEENFAREKDLSDKKIAAKEAEDLALKNLGNQGVAAAKDLFAKNKAIQKGIIVAESGVALGKLAINTVEAVGKDNAASPLTFGMPWSGIHIGQGVLGAATIISNTSKQLQAIGGGGGGVASSGGSATSQIRSAAPPSVAFNNSAENQIGKSISRTQAEQPPIKVNVLESDITTAQNNVNVLVKKNEF